MNNRGAIPEAERVRRELRDALEAAGVMLPSLGLDPLSCTGPNPRPLIDLGRCDMATARGLTVLLREHREWGRGMER
ncbi:hypothetical protein E0L36_04505 [Streptomyces sp. AJS327]|uniref:hypothetical protein n=1 Tax=Streptomyces sp. AJS327 TaxID=2545265 RepID=UPI0015DDA529|nr:hypothetical protein [Streptomyces sp. AJS327]MBA0050184.1 hypothetical protein [Streptomyces sp. AJS327]